MTRRNGTLSQGFERFDDGTVIVETAYEDEGDGTYSKAVSARLRVWDSNTLDWVRWSGAGAGGGGGGGAATVADGADVAQGSTSDVAWVSGSGSLIAISKAEHAKLEQIRALLAGTLAVNGLTDTQLRATPVAISATALPLAPDAATQTTLGAMSSNLGTTADGAAAGNGSLIGVVKQLRALLAAGLPAALGGAGGLKVEQQGTHGVTVADGADVTQGTTSDTASASTVVGLLKAIKAAITGTLAVSGSLGRSWTLGSGTDSVNVGNLPVTQPVSAAALPLPAGAATETTLASANTSLGTDGATPPAITGTGIRGWLRAIYEKLASSITVSGTVTANQGGAPWSENLSQIAGTALAAKALPANADGQVAIPVYVNAQQYATYDVAMRAIATGVLTTNTAKPVMSFEHAPASTKTVRIRRIMIHALQSSALAGAFDLQIMKGTAASTAGTGVTPNPRKGGDPAAEMVVKSLPTIVAATLGDIIPAGGFATTTSLYSPPALVYDWQEAGETKPLILRAGVSESIVLNVISVQALNLTLTVSVDFTEE